MSGGDERPPDPMLEEAGSELCRSCGLCCDGTLFGHVPVTRDEANGLRHRLPIVRATDERGDRIEQGCAALGPRGCDVYDVRPAACADYQCTLLRRVRSGDTLPEDAARTLARILELVDRVRDALPSGSGLRTRLSALADAHAMTRLRGEVGEAAMDLKLLHVMLPRHLHDRALSSKAIP